MSCPCGGAELATCCGRFVDGGELPTTAEQLMRSRYTAYVLGRPLYLRETWDPRTRPSSVDRTGVDWLGLTVLRFEEHGDRATVEFVARYREKNVERRLHETSRFERRKGRWLYVDGDVD